MANEFLSVLKQIYSSGGLPCAITDDKLNTLWRNSLASTHRSPLSRDSLAFLFEDRLPAAGTASCTENETVFRFNVLKAEDPADGSVFYIAEQIRSDEIKDLLTSPSIKAYMSYLCAKIREAAGMITVSADEIDSVTAIFGSASGEITEQLNTINRGIMLILREVVDPEQLYYTLDPYCDDATMCIADELKKSSEKAARSLGRDTRVYCEGDGKIFTRMNRDVFETIVADMAAECCESKFFPEELIFSCKMVSPARVLVSVESFNRSGKKNKASVAVRDKKGSRLYSDYLRKVMCEKYGAEFTAKEIPSGYLCSIELDTVGSDEKILFNAKDKLDVLSDRFCAMKLCLAEHHLEERYMFIDIDKDQD